MTAVDKTFVITFHALHVQPSQTTAHRRLVVGHVLYNKIDKRRHPGLTGAATHVILRNNYVGKHCYGGHLVIGKKSSHCQQTFLVRQLFLGAVQIKLRLFSNFWFFFFGGTTGNYRWHSNGTCRY